VIIDSHTHIFSPEVIQNREKYCTSDSCFGLLYSQEKSRMGTAEDLISIMDQRRVSRSLVLNIGWDSHEMCVRTNDYILEAAARYPERLTALCSIQPRAGERALKEIERCHKAGARGFGELRPDVQGFDLLDTSVMSAVVELIIKLDMVLSVHASEPVGHEYAGKGKTTPDILYPFICLYPGLKILLGHFGGGLAFYELMPEVARNLQNVYYDTAAAPFLYSPQIYKMLIAVGCGHKILFGSDWPLLDPARIIDHIKALPPESGDLEDILYANAGKFLGIT